MLISPEHRFIAAAAVAREAGVVAKSWFNNRTGLEVKFKGPQDYVTQVDGAVERLIIERLHQVFPLDTFFGEETGGELSDHVWIIDPIDGTANYAHGVPHYAISIAFVEGGKAMIGAIYDPTLDNLYMAQRAHGAFKNGQPIHSSACTRLADASVELGFSRRYPVLRYTRLMERLMMEGTTVVWRGSAVLALAFVAEGASDAYCDLHLNSWDAAAGALLVQEAGGWANEFLSGPGMREGNALIACTGALRDSLRALGVLDGPQTSSTPLLR